MEKTCMMGSMHQVRQGDGRDHATVPKQWNRGRTLAVRSEEVGGDAKVRRCVVAKVMVVIVVVGTVVVVEVVEEEEERTKKEKKSIARARRAGEKVCGARRGRRQTTGIASPDWWRRCVRCMSVAPVPVPPPPPPRGRARSVSRGTV